MLGFNFADVFAIALAYASSFEWYPERPWIEY